MSIEPVYSNPNARGQVALTFDDGPNGAYTDEILDTLERNGVDATFFVLGENAAGHHDTLRRMRDEGHTVANHSWSHPQMTSLSNEDAAWQLDRTSDEIEAAIGERPTLFRAPYGDRNARVDGIVGAEGMRDILWNVDTRDWARPGSEAIRSAAVNDAQDGSIILMHDGGGNRAQTVAALQQIIDGLRARGLEPVTVPQLLER